MRIRFDNILLGILWMLAMTLGASFWFNTVYGFDIFSASHWQYLSYMQAGRTPVRIGFYISMVIIIFATIFGMYLVMRPRTRKIKLPIIKTSKPSGIQGPNVITNNNTPSNATIKTSEFQNPDSSTLDVLPSETQIPNNTQNKNVPNADARPPRLVLPMSNRNYISTPPQQTQPSQNITQNSVQNDRSELREIFESAGYVVKSAPQINGIQIALLAIGTNETLWIGGVGIKTTDMRTAIDRLQQIFSDTLDETYINVNGFVVNAPDAATSEFQDILMFNSISDLRQYMRGVPNPPLSPDDDGMFDAYSQYIDAVINHIGLL